MPWFPNIFTSFHMSQFFTNMSRRDKLGERMNNAAGKKSGGRFEVSVSVSIAYILLVSWNSILRPSTAGWIQQANWNFPLGRHSEEGALQTQSLFTQQHDGQVFLVLASTGGGSKRWDMLLLSLPTLTPTMDSLDSFSVAAQRLRVNQVLIPGKL